MWMAGSLLRCRPLVDSATKKHIKIEAQAGEMRLKLAHFNVQYSISVFR
jgi:hypothetical protein